MYHQSNEHLLNPSYTIIYHLLLLPLRLALSLQLEVVPPLLQQPERRVSLGAMMLQRQSAFTNVLPS